MSKKQLSLKEKLSLLPHDPGVYLMKDKAGKIIYVGKAKVLKNRVTSYFNRKHPDIKTNLLVQNIADFKIFAVKTELEALILENDLIKKYDPQFNIALKDNRQYPYIKITYHHDFPKIEIARQKENDGDKYFGPFHGGGTIKRATSVIKNIFRLRTCGDPLPKRACLEYYLGNCDAPCVNKISQPDYLKIAKQVERFLNGEYEFLHKEIQAHMKNSASQKQFEKAIFYRNQLQNLEKIMERQSMHTYDHESLDILNFAFSGEMGVLFLIQVRKGRIIGDESFTLVANDNHDPQELFERVFLNYYSETQQYPKEILVPKGVKDERLLQKWLKSEAHAKAKIILPADTESFNLLRIAKRNALLQSERERAEYVKKGNRQGALVELQSLLKMKRLPLVIEGFDISHIQGFETVASMVYFNKGFPQKQNYRKFILKSTQGKPDDFLSMEEVVKRRYSRLLKEKKPLPDVILIDGGKGQLSSAIKSLESLKLMKKVKVMSIAKQEEEFFLPGIPQSIKLFRDSQLLKLIQHVRDESHRFAINFHRSRRKKSELKSRFDNLKGIGKVKQQLIKDHFGTFENFRGTTLDELATLKGVGKKLAKKLIEQIK